jgi:diguanylate cyclase (GGDEF)-like protein
LVVGVGGVVWVVVGVVVWVGVVVLVVLLGSLLADQPLDVVLTGLCRSIGALLGADGAIVHHGFDGEVFHGATGWGVPGVGLDGGPWVETARGGLTQSHRLVDLPPETVRAALAHGLRECWTVPVPTSPGLAPAVLSVWRTEESGPLVGHRHALDRSVRYAQLALVRTAEHQRLRYIPGHDSLTGVANRSEFRDALAYALAIGERNIALAFCDLDGFKGINDTYGHNAGDRVLVQVADRLRARLRTGDELARIGGDEFTILLRNIPDAATAHHVAARLLTAVAEPFELEGQTIPLGLSVGIALSKPGLTADALLARADAALYDVKHAGGNQASVAP